MNALLCSTTQDVRQQFRWQRREDILREASIEGMFEGFRKAVEFACRTRLSPAIRRCPPPGDVNAPGAAGK